MRDRAVDPGVVEPPAPISLGDESELIARVRRADPEAQEQFVRGYSGQMLAVARRYFRSEQDADDAHQRRGRAPGGCQQRVVPSRRGDPA